MRVENATVDDYGSYLKDKYRPPSRGGNARAWHQHVLTIGGEKYSFLGLGARKWIYSSDTVSFDWDWDESGRYRNVAPGSVETYDKTGKPVTRGDRGEKPWRTADARMPASQREQRD
ncbi:MAG TPA: hypothetical protein VGX71_05865 [Pseudaminobacter sp.]|nr:hypothetical protein [Pseudaminobacter sp.]